MHIFLYLFVEWRKKTLTIFSDIRNLLDGIGEYFYLLV